MPYEDWLNEYMLGYHDMTIVPARTVFNGVTSKNLITVLQSLPRDSGVYQTGMITLLIDEGWLLSQIVPDSTYDRAVYVFSQEGELILKSNDKFTANIDPTMFAKDHGSGSLNIDGQSIHFSYVKSGAMGWTYVLMLPTEQFFSRVSELRAGTMAALTIVGVIGILLTALVAYMSFISTSSALHMIDQSGRHTVPYSISIRDIGAYIQEALENRNLYIEHIPLLIETYIYKLISGVRDAGADLAMVSEVLGFRFPTNQFVVMSFHINTGEEIHDRLRAMLASIQALPDAGMDMYGTVLPGDTVAVLISFWAGGTEEYRDMLYRSADRLMRGLYGPGNAHPDIGISLVGDKYEEINALYRQSQLCLAGTCAQHDGRILFYADIARVVPPSDYSYSLSAEKNLISYVCAGDSLRMNKLLDEIFAIHEQEARMVEGMTECLKYDMIGTLFHCAQKVNQDAGLERETWETIQAIMALNRPDAIYEKMHRAFSTLCDRAYAARGSHNDSMRDTMLQYLADNYRDPDMGLDMVARAFGLTPSYMSRFFKEQTGGTLVDHISRLRVEHAAQLLRTTALSYSEVAEECGLSGSQALNRLFNRVLGVSPTVYRQLARQGGLDINS